MHAHTHACSHVCMYIYLVLIIIIVPVSADYNVAVSKVDTAMNTSDLGTTTDDEESAMLLKSKRMRR